MPVVTAEAASLSITPDTTVIAYMRKQHLSWHVILKELIDNAIDASASRIWIEVQTKRYLRVTDNGRGCADLEAMVTLGRRAQHPATQIGQNGIGLKDAAIWLADRLRIRSVRDGMAREIEVNWEHILRNRDWLVGKPIKEYAVEEANGTQIILTDLRKGRPDRRQLVEDLAQTYRPALERGCQLFVKFANDPAFVPLTPFAYPPLLHQQTETLTVAGKTAQVTMGMVPPEQPFQGRGLLYIYGPRVIVHHRRAGIPPAALSELFGWVEFAPDWVLEKNKVDFLEDLTPLEEAITTRFAALIAQASHHHVAQPLEDISKILNERLKAFRLTQGPRRKARRDGPSTKTGTATPTGEGTPLVFLDDANAPHC